MKPEYFQGLVANLFVIEYSKNCLLGRSPWQLCEGALKRGERKVGRLVLVVVEIMRRILMTPT